MIRHLGLVVLTALGLWAWSHTAHAALILQLESQNYNAGTGTWTATAGPNATQGTVGNRPTLVTNATPTGASAVRFDGGDWLSLASSIGNTGGIDAYTIFAVVRPDPSAARVQALAFTWHRGEIVAAA